LRNTRHERTVDSDKTAKGVLFPPLFWSVILRVLLLILRKYLMVISISLRCVHRISAQNLHHFIVINENAVAQTVLGVSEVLGFVGFSRTRCCLPTYSIVSSMARCSSRHWFPMNARHGLWLRWRLLHRICRYCR
jgi:hypothetical protein